MTTILPTGREVRNAISAPAGAKEIAEISCANDVVDLDLAAFATPAPQSAPQHLY